MLMTQTKASNPRYLVSAYPTFSPVNGQSADRSASYAQNRHDKQQSQRQLVDAAMGHSAWQSLPHLEKPSRQYGPVLPNVDVVRCQTQNGNFDPERSIN